MPPMLPIPPLEPEDPELPLDSKEDELDSTATPRLIEPPAPKALLELLLKPDPWEPDPKEPVTPNPFSVPLPCVPLFPYEDDDSNDEDDDLNPDCPFAPKPWLLAPLFWLP